MKTKNLKINYLVIKLKGYAMKLRSNYQIPYYLCYLIRNIDTDKDSVSYVESLKRYTEHYIRVKGYYKRYPIVEKESNDELKKIFKKD